MEREREEDVMLRIATVKITNCICGPHNRQKYYIRKKEKKQDKRSIENEITKNTPANKQNLTIIYLYNSSSSVEESTLIYQEL